ncbi:MAG: glycosyltransferase, partial [Patescibacteria group bacterium]|nr:glycosyltransferase [Patescibacteria group bacterium]
RKIIKWVSKKDDGQVKAINQGLRKASGEVVTFINADDVYKQDALLRVGRYFQLNPNQLWLTGYGDIINNSSQQTNFLVTKYKNALIAKNHKLLLYMVNYITQPSTFWRRKVHRKIGYLTGTKNYVMEYDFWLKLWGMQKPAIIKNYLASFRLTSDNISATSFNSLLRLDYQIAEDYTNNPAILFLHRIHNLSRVVLLRLLKND